MFMKNPPIYIDTEDEYQEALLFVKDLWGIEQYVDIKTFRDINDMVNAIEDYEDWHYPMGI